MSEFKGVVDNPTKFHNVTRQLSNQLAATRIDLMNKHTKYEKSKGAIERAKHRVRRLDDEERKRKSRKYSECGKGGWQAWGVARHPLNTRTALYTRFFLQCEPEAAHDSPIFSTEEGFLHLALTFTFPRFTN